MTKGKMISQGSHASLGVILRMMNGGVFKKVCVYVNSEEELIEIYNRAKAKGLPVIMIEDSGLTMFKGIKTNTCIAIGPAGEQIIDKITGELKLL